MVDWLWELYTERSVDNKKSASRVEECYHDPTPHKKSRKDCNNYRGIALLSVPGKVLSLILHSRLQAIIELQLFEAQCGSGRVEELLIRSG